MAISVNELLNAAVSSRLLDEPVIQTLRVEARRRRVDVLEMATSHGRFPRSSLYRAVAEERGMRFVDSDDMHPPRDLLEKVPSALMQRHDILPIAREDDRVVVATCDPDNMRVTRMLEQTLGCAIEMVLASPEELQHAIRRLLGSTVRVPEDDPADDSDAVVQLERVMREAYLSRASDIHIEPQDNRWRVRVRVDGRLRKLPRSFDQSLGASIASRVKVLAGLDIAESRAPQDGGFTHEFAGGMAPTIDIRVATIPTRGGERVTMRLLETGTGALTLRELGMAQPDLQCFQSWIDRPHGIVLITGPTGSGKSTSLYAALRQLNNDAINILTVEDPIEQVIDGISQVHVGMSDKISFHSALRSLLRHDPDVLMIGEIRDRETASIAIRAALTGHLVFSTLHTNDARSAMTRLADLGCEPYLIASTVLGVMAQRLVRRLCPRCRQPREAGAQEARMLTIDESAQVYTPSGCSCCAGTGYRGRIGIFELMSVDQTLSRLIAQGATEQQIAQNVQRAYTTLGDDARRKVLEGSTSIQEVRRVTGLEA